MLSILEITLKLLWKQRNTKVTSFVSGGHWGDAGHYEALPSPLQLAVTATTKHALSCL
jgi:hypothetical protein